MFKGYKNQASDIIVGETVLIDDVEYIAVYHSFIRKDVVKVLDFDTPYELVEHNGCIIPSFKINTKEK